MELIVACGKNAFIAAGYRTQGGTIYVWGKPICARCADLISQAGIKRIAALSPETVGEKSKWLQTGMYAQQMFHEAGVEVDFYAANE